MEKIFFVFFKLFFFILWLIGEGVIRGRRMSFGFFCDVIGLLGNDGNFVMKI